MKIKKPATGKRIDIKVSDFVKDLAKYVKADMAFQANPESRWSPEQMSSYVTSSILGMATSTFVLADVRECLKETIKQEQKHDIAYYQQWIKLGVYYLNIDGNNRVIVLLGFIAGKFGIEPGPYLIDGTMFTIDKTNNKIDTLPSKIKNMLMDMVIPLYVYADVSRDQLSEIFTRINDGKPLNQPELRNAQTSDIATIVRNLASKHKKRFGDRNTCKWFTKEDLIRRGIDDFIAGLCFIYFNDHTNNINPQNLLDMYDTGSLENQAVKSFEKSFDSFMKNILSDKNLNALPNKNSILDLFVIWNDKMKNDFVFKNNTSKKQFITNYIKTIGILIKNDKVYVIDKKANRKNKTFEDMLSTRSNTVNQFRINLIVKNMKLDKYFNQLSKRKSLTKNQKLVKVVEQDGITLDTNKIIDLSQLHNGKKYHSGHKIPHADQGSSNLNNLVIQDAGDNLKQGRKPLKVIIN